MAMISNIQFQLQVRQIVGAQPRAEAIVVAIVMLMIIGRICAWVFGGFWHGDRMCQRRICTFPSAPQTLLLCRASQSAGVDLLWVWVPGMSSSTDPKCGVGVAWRGVLLPIARSSSPHPLDRLAWRSGRLGIVPLNHLNSRSSDVAMHMAHPLSHQYQY